MADIYSDSSCHTISVLRNEIIKTNTGVLQRVTVWALVENVKHKQYELRRRNEFTE